MRLPHQKAKPLPMQTSSFASVPCGLDHRVIHAKLPARRKCRNSDFGTVYTVYTVGYGWLRRSEAAAALGVKLPYRNPCKAPPERPEQQTLHPDDYLRLPAFHKLQSPINTEKPKSPCPLGSNTPSTVEGSLLLFALLQKRGDKTTA